MSNPSSDFETRRQLLQMQMLYEIGLAINSSLDLTHVVEEILNRAIVMVDARVGLLVISDNGKAKIVGQVGVVDDLTSILDLPQVAQAWNEEQLSQYVVSISMGEHICIVPLVSRGETEGLLIFFDKEKRNNTVGPFEEQDESLLQSFAYQAGASLHNARLYESLDVAYEELKTAQRKLAQMEQLRALGELGAQVAHAMNHTLGIIAGHADMYLSFGRDPDNAMKTILDTAESGQDVMERIQQFIRLNVGKKRVPVDIIQLIEESINDIKALWLGRHGENVSHVEWIVHLEEVSETYANPTDIKEVISNITLNALEAMPSGGRLEIRCYEKQEFIDIVINDTGIGMNEETQKNIFAPFFSTNDEWATGLGLAISYRIVADHNGEIEVSSSVGKGSCFTVRLPINVEPQSNLEEHDDATDIDS